MKLVLVRHGESQWNKSNLFTGWVDIDLSADGVEEAKVAGQRLKLAGLSFSMTYTSVLKRAIKTLHYILEEIDQLWVQEYKSWRLNERHYGALSGLNKAETAAQYGAEQVQIWRRSYDILPPLSAMTDKYHPINDARYHALDPRSLPAGENLKITLARVIPFWEDQIAPRLRNHENILIVAHGNSLRALVKYLENISDDDIMELNIPTGIPIVYELDEHLAIVDKKMLSPENG